MDLLRAALTKTSQFIVKDLLLDLSLSLSILVATLIVLLLVTLGLLRLKMIEFILKFEIMKTPVRKK